MMGLYFSSPNKTQAAALLRVSPSTLYGKLQTYEAGTVV